MFDWKKVKENQVRTIVNFDSGTYTLTITKNNKDNINFNASVKFPGRSTTSIFFETFTKIRLRENPDIVAIMETKLCKYIGVSPKGNLSGKKLDDILECVSKKKGAK